MTDSELVEQAILDRDFVNKPGDQILIFTYKGKEYRISYEQTYFGYSNAIEFKSLSLFLPKVKYHKRRKIDTNSICYKLTRIVSKDVEGIWRAIRKLQKRIEDFADFEEYKIKLLDEVVKPKIIEFLLEDSGLSSEDINSGDFKMIHEFWIYRTYTKSALTSKTLKLYTLSCTFTKFSELSRYFYTFDIKYPNRWWYKEVNNKQIELERKIITYYREGVPLINMIRYARLKKIANVE